MRISKNNAGPVQYLIILAISSFLLAFTWPWEAQKANTEEKPKTPPQEEQTRFEEETREVEWKLQDKEEKTGEAAQGAVPAPTPKAVHVYKPAFKPVTPLPPRAYATNPVPSAVKYTKITQVVQPPIDISILNLQKQISDIIKLNESIKASQQTQVGEVQRIIEQARFHQRILTELKEGEEKGEAKPSDAETLLKQEKVRLIGEQTEQNKEFIEEIKKALEAEKAQGVESQDGESQPVESEDTSPDLKQSSDNDDQPIEDER